MQAYRMAHVAGAVIASLRWTKSLPMTATWSAHLNPRLAVEDLSGRLSFKLGTSSFLSGPDPFQCSHRLCNEAHRVLLIVTIYSVLQVLVPSPSDIMAKYNSCFSFLLFLVRYLHGDTEAFWSAVECL
eukprot:scpid89294/ scgid8200/ 